MGKRLTGISGALFSVLCFVFLIMLDLPDLTTSNAYSERFWDDAGHQTRIVIASSVCGLAVLLLVAFVVGLSWHLRAAGAPVAAYGVLVAGGLTSAMILVSGALFAAPALALALNNEPVTLDSDVGLAMRTSSFLADSVILWFVGFAAAGVVAATTLGGRSVGWPVWAVVLGALVVVFLMTPLVFLTLMLFLLWTLVLSVLLLLGRGLPVV